MPAWPSSNPFDRCRVTAYNARAARVTNNSDERRVNSTRPDPPAPGELDRLAAAMNGGRYAEAGALARALLDRYPHVGFLWKLYGAALLRQGEDALPRLQRAIQLLPDDDDTHCDLGTALRRRGDVAGAVARYQRALELRPGHLAALVELADALQLCGRFAEAVATYRRVLDIAPQVAEVHNNLGNALKDLGQLDDALASYGRALAIEPDFAAAHSNLGNALRGLGRFEEAALSCRRALAIKPDFAEAYNNLGNALKDLGQLTDALASYGRALELDPRFADAHSNFGNALRDIGRLQEALVSYRRALELEPALAEAHYNLGNLHLDLMQLNEAEASYRRALALRPDYVRAHTSLARVLRQQGHAAAAETSCRRALGVTPGCAESIAFLAELHADRGEFAEAEALFKRALEIDPDLSAAWAGLARCRRMADGDSSWLAAAQRLAARKLPLREEIYLRFAIGKYFDDVKNYEHAFESYCSANELTKRYGPMFDRSEFSRQVDRLVHGYGRDWLSRVRYQGAPSERAVFIVGMPRSGTSLVEQILASHPAVFGAGELPFWNDAAAVFDSSASGAATEASMIGGFAQDYLRHLGELSPDARRVVDKMPTNFVMLGLIHAALPNARIIHMRRNPLDTCLSIYFQNFSMAHAYASDLEDLAHYYSEYLRLMAHWHAVLPAGMLLDASYEDLVFQPEASIRGMLEFVGLPWDGRCLDFHATNRTVITSSRWQVRQKISSTSVGRWRNYERFVGPLRRLLACEAREQPGGPAGTC
jgi:tetratricopeptide (TPR) repeat protein